MQRFFLMIAMILSSLFVKGQDQPLKRTNRLGQIPGNKVKIRVKNAPSSRLSIGIITELCDGEELMIEQKVSDGNYYLRLDTCGCGDGNFCDKQATVHTKGLGTWWIKLEGGMEYLVTPDGIDGKWKIIPVINRNGATRAP